MILYTLIIFIFWIGLLDPFFTLVCFTIDKTKSDLQNQLDLLMISEERIINRTKILKLYKDNPMILVPREEIKNELIESTLFTNTPN